MSPPTPVLSKERRRRLREAPGRAQATLARLSAQHPTAHCELDHRSPFELLVAVVLSAQTTDVAVNKATPKLFARFPDARSLAVASPADVEPLIASLGFFRTKSKAIVGLAHILVTAHGGEVPRSLDELVKIARCRAQDSQRCPRRGLGVPGGDDRRHACFAGYSATRMDAPRRSGKDRARV